MSVNMQTSAVILLTGTINPKNMVFTQIQDMETRKNQYIASIRFWVNVAHVPVVFVENSNVDLSDYFKNEIRSNTLELLTFNGNDYDRNLGKGYGELSCLEHAYASSIYIKKADFIFKVTGRYKVLNFSTFWERYIVEPETDILADFKWNLSFCDSRFFGFRPSFIINYLVKYKDVIDDSKGIFFEHILSKAILTAIADNSVYRPLITLPRIEGYSASSGAKYNSNYLHWLRYKFEYIIKHRSIGLGNLPWI